VGLGPWNGAFATCILRGVRRLVSILAGLACFPLVGCSAAKQPSSHTPVAAVVNARPSAPAAGGAPELALEQEQKAPNPGQVDKGPELDCSKFPKGKPPDRRWLCDLVMNDRSWASAVDARGFAAVEYYVQPGEGEGTGLIQSKERVCGAKAEKRFADIARTLRYKLAMSLNDPEHVECKKLDCMLAGRSEYETSDTLSFRQGAHGLVLASWTSIEVVLVDSAEVEARYAWVAKGLAEVTGQRCP
jgi:hypothetical protein